MAQFNQYPAPALPLTGQEQLVLSQPQGVNNVTVTATVSQLVGAITPPSVGKIVTNIATTSSAPQNVPNMPSVPNGGGLCAIQGIITAQDETTRDSAMWNVALLVKRTATGVACVTVGDITPSVFAQEGTTVSCSISLSAGQSGPIITVTGLSSSTTSFDVNLDFTLGN